MVNLNDPRELYYIREGTTRDSSRRPGQLVYLSPQQQEDLTYGLLSLVPIGKGAQLSWRAGKGLARFAKRGGFYHARRGGSKAVGYYRRASARVRRPIRGSRTYGRISRRLPFYKTRQRVRAATDLAADAAVVYYGGRRVYRKTRALGARSKTSPTRTAYSQRYVRNVKSPSKKARRTQRRTRCPPGHYYNYKAGKCLKSRFRR